MQNVDTLFKYGISFQTKVLSTLVADIRILDTIGDIINPSYFESDVHKWIAGEVLGYYTEFKKSPTLDVFKAQVLKVEDAAFQKNIVEQLKTVFSKIDDGDFDYVKKEFSSFCINQNLKNAIIQSVDLLKSGDYDKIKDLIDRATKVGTDSNIGTDYVLDYEKRTSNEARETVTTGWDVVDELMGGGLGPGELGVIVAPSGAGKTWNLCAIGAAAVRRGLKVVHYSLELSESYVGQRYDTIFTQIPSHELQDKKIEVRDTIGKLTGKLIIKYFPPKGITAKKIESHISKMTSLGHKPDLVIIDYADLLLSYTNRSDSTYGEQGGVYIELRGMGGEIGVPIWTASQARRSSVESEIIEANEIADSYAKVMNADFIISVSRKSKDKINNTARFYVMKNRFGPDGITFPSKVDTNRGIIELYASSSANGVAATQDSMDGERLEKQLLHKKYVENFG